MLRIYGGQEAKDKAKLKTKLNESQTVPLSQLLTCGVFSRNRGQDDYLTESGYRREKPIQRKRQIKPHFFAN